jgi:hypothetical protein
MRLLPDAAITANTSNGLKVDNKGKRKASDTGDSSRASKKAERDEDFDDDASEEDGSSGGNELHAMQVEE